MAQAFPVCPRINVIDVNVNAATFREAQDFIAVLVERRMPAFVSCANAYSLALARDRRDYREILNRAAFVTADGMPVVWTLKFLGHRAERVHNDDLFFALTERYPGWRHLLVGGREGQAMAATELLQRRFPGILIVGSHATPVRPV